MAELYTFNCFIKMTVIKSVYFFHTFSFPPLPGISVSVFTMKVAQDCLNRDPKAQRNMSFIKKKKKKTHTRFSVNLWSSLLNEQQQVMKTWL